MKIIIKKWLLLFAVLCLSACASVPRQGKLKYAFNFNAYESNRVFLFTASFNGYYVPAGAIGCCVGRGGKSSAGFVQYPSNGHFEWRDKKTGLFYRADIVYPDNIAEIADSLSDVVWFYSQKEPRKVRLLRLITSITKDNSVVSAIANAGLGSNVKKREIIELARAKGEVFEYKRKKKVKQYVDPQ